MSVSGAYELKLENDQNADQNKVAERGDEGADTTAGTASGTAGGKKKSKAKSKSSRAGLQFPVGRLGRLLRKGKYAKQVGGGAPVYLASVLEFLTADLLELAGHAARSQKRARITARHLQLAVAQDVEFNKLLSGVTIASGGVLPQIQPALVPNKVKKH